MKYVDGIQKRKQQQKGQSVVWLIKVIAIATLIVMAIDFAGFVSWKAANQMPPDNFFIGSLTNQLLK